MGVALMSCPRKKIFCVKFFEILKFFKIALTGVAFASIKICVKFSGKFLRIHPAQNPRKLSQNPVNIFHARDRFR